MGGQSGTPGKALQGNIDPNVLFARPDQIAEQVAKVLEDFGAPHIAPSGEPDRVGPTQIFNLGHGISQHTPPENVAALVDAVHACSRRMRA